VSEIERKLAAIFAADVEGYSRLMGLDEVGTLRTLTAYRAIIDGLIAQHRGRIFNTAGDSVLAEFPSVVDAVQCAISVQRTLGEENEKRQTDQQMRYRIGVHVGDVLVQGANLFGDGVNIAARLETLAEPGGICVSGAVRDYLGKKLPVVFTDFGEQTVKNIAEPVRAYRIGASATAPIGAPDRTPLPLPDKPSIFVLPFTSMSSDPDQQYFADGLTEDLITDLSKVPGFFVIARNSSFSYKGKAVDVRQIAREMGVRYILEGSARRSSERIRINAQLIDAVGGGHVWADRFDRDLVDIFAVQDEVISKIVTVLAGKLVAGRLHERQRTANLDAYDCCVRGKLGHWNAKSPEQHREARALLEKAIALDPEYAEAHAWLAFTRWFAWVHWGSPSDLDRAGAVSIALRAVALDPRSATTQWVLGLAMLFERRWAEGLAAIHTALQLDPNRADVWIILAMLMILEGRPTEAVECARKAFRLDPHPTGLFYWILGEAQYAARQYDLAIDTLRNAATYERPSRRILAASLAQLGCVDDARREAQAFMAANPNFTISQWAATQPHRDERVSQHFIEGYRKAGLPE
jgi:TolB-like protein/class 3 adenylate cyclase